MVKAKDKKNRMLEIFYRAMVGGNINTKALADEYGVSGKSISRDIGEIKNFLSDNRDLVNYKDLRYSASSKTYHLEFDHVLLSKELIAIIKVLIGCRAFSKEELLTLISKLKAFAESGLYFSDCAATSGSQIVITPDGQVGICHGAMEKREHFIGSIDDENLVVDKNAEVNHWNHLSPVFKEECQNCEALGICGGGCPVNAQKLNNTASIDAIDKAFCIHAKKVLEYLIGELLKYSVREAEECV